MQKWNRIKYQPNLPLYESGKVTESKEHIELSKNAAKEGMVLLKNENGALPLRKGERIALFGKGTCDYVKGGGGSGDVTVSYMTNLYEGFKQLSDRVSLFTETAEYYKDYVEKEYEKGNAPGMIEEPALPDDLLNAAVAWADTAVISISRFSGEGWDRKVAGVETDMGRREAWVAPMQDLAEKLFPKGDFYLTDQEEAMIKKVESSFDKVIVVLNVGGMVDSQWFKNDDKISAAFLSWQGGTEGGLAAAELLCGIGNPSGKLSDTFAKELTDYPSTAGFHTSPDYVEYNEDIYVGYRYFETIDGMAERVNYPFGFGLSYTSFDIDNLELETRVDATGYVTVRLDVTNVGPVAGKEVIQIYYEAPQGLLGKPKKALAAYLKTRELAPGETQKVEISYPVNQMASYDDLGKIEKSAYILEKGEYHIFVGTSVRDVYSVGYMEIEDDVLVEKLSEHLKPVQLSKRMLADGTYEGLEQGEPRDPNYIELDENPLGGSSGYGPVSRRVEGQNLWDPGKNYKQLSDVAEGKLSMEDFMAQLSDLDLASLLGGQPNTGVANTYGFGNLLEYGVPNAMTVDGPAGVRIMPEVGVHTTAFPCSTLLACTWNPDVTYSVGCAAGEEVKENNLAVWLAPAINIHRSPLCGRNFEYYSEDPLLTGKQAAALVRGVQSNHVAVSLKHFALNNKETNRFESDSRVSERAAREIYLKAFEIVVKEADPWTIMSSYNIINGVRASENRELLTDILRGEWGFKGMVTTDWWNHAEQYKEVLAGNDVKMAIGFPERLVEAEEKGLLTREDMEICARRVLELLLKLD